MSLDYLSIVSLGVYPTSGKTDKLRAALGVSMGLLNMALPGTVVSAIKIGMLNIGKAGIKGARRLLRIGR